MERYGASYLAEHSLRTGRENHQRRNYPEQQRTDRDNPFHIKRRIHQTDADERLPDLPWLQKQKSGRHEDEERDGCDCFHPTLRG
ncbi:hypothetical protein SDC9_113250 [bioreactor metagenome]|uniref:Uncharacterized protein n=1 Tax=bioreactor metagenome TaxID=1076179 RepID=A0A645BSX0_9ZZZZ